MIYSSRTDSSKSPPSNWPSSMMAIFELRRCDLDRIELGVEGGSRDEDSVNNAEDSSSSGASLDSDTAALSTSWEVPLSSAPVTRRYTMPNKTINDKAGAKRLTEVSSRPSLEARTCSGDRSM